MRGKRSRAAAWRVGLLAIGALMALPVGSALADATIGQTGGTATCASNSGLADTSYVVPAGGGTITSFSFQSVAGNAGEQVDFLVLRPAAAGGYTVVGKTGLVTLAGTGLETVPAAVAVEAGDVLGIYVPSALLDCGTFPGSSGGGILSLSADPSVGDAVSITALPFDPNESATLVTLPTSRRQCKHGGWRTDGTTFKNQGDCVRWVRTHRKHDRKN